jgi:hypothetical protein
MFPQPDPATFPRRPRRRWAAGAASALAAVLLAGGGTAVALQAHSTPVPAAQAPQPQADESLAGLTSLDGLGADVAAADSGAAAVQDASLLQPAVPAAAGAAPSPSAAASSAKHPARAALRRVLAVVIRQDGSAQYGQHAQAAARAAANRYPAAFRHLPAKLRDDLWTLAGAAPGQEVADAQAIKAHALDGTYGAGVKELAEAIQKAPAKPKSSSSPSAPVSPSPSAPVSPSPSAPAPSAPASPSPSPSAGS